MSNFFEKLKNFFLKLKPRRFLSAISNFSKKEKAILAIFISCGIIGLAWFLINNYFKNTQVVADYGGAYIEGVVSFPRYLNPVIIDNNDAESILEGILFSSLFKNDGSGKLTNDLIKEVEKTETNAYLLTIKDNVLWHDGEKLTTDDLIFTIELLKNDYFSNPYSLFLKEISIEQISPLTIKITFPQEYFFWQNYFTFKILPKHLWKDVPIENFILSDLNLKPIGSGPFKFQKSVLDKNGRIIQFNLVYFNDYFEGRPYLNNLVFKFFPDYNSALSSLKKNEILALSSFRVPVESQTKFSKFNLTSSNFYSLTFNLNETFLQDDQIRQALNLALNKQEIKDKLNLSLKPISSVADVYLNLDFINEFNPAKAGQILEEAGFQDSNQDGILDKKINKKDKEPTNLAIEILVLDDPDLNSMAQIISQNFKNIGIEATIKNLSFNEFNSRLQTNSFQAALIGQRPIVNELADFYAFFHSSQIPPLGFNFAFYKSKEADELLEKLRALDSNKQELLANLGELIKSDLPIIPLFQQETYWLVAKDFNIPQISFINSTGERFTNINNWYLNTKRI